MNSTMTNLTIAPHGTTPACAFVGDQSLVVRCVEIARDAGLRVAAVASHSADVLDAIDAPGARSVRLERPSDLAGALDGIEIDVVFSVAYLHVVPDEVLDRVSLAVNFHDGPLPAYAGLNVTSWAIANGESEHAVTWHVMTSDLDAGEVLVSAGFPIEPGESALSLNARCFEVGAQTFSELARAVASGHVESRPQSGSGNTYLRRDRPVALVDPARPASDLERAVRAVQVGDRVVNTVGAAHLVADGRALVVGEPEVLANDGLAAGSTRREPSGALRIATVDGDLVLRDVRRPDGSPFDGDVADVTPPRGLPSALAEHDPEFSDGESWWRARLAEPVSMPTLDGIDPSHPVSAGSLKGASDPASAAAALLAVLAAHADADRVSIRVTDPAARERLDAVAPLASAPVVTVDVAADLTLEALTAVVGDALGAALSHGPYLADLVGRDPDARDTFVAPTAELRIGADHDAPPADSPVVLLVADDGTTSLAACATEATAATLAGRIDHVLAQFTDHPNRLVRDLEITTPDDIAAFERLNDTVTPVDSATIDELFRRRVAADGDRAAVSCGQVTLTYSQLSHRVAELAAGLREAGVGHGDVVGIALARSVDLVAAVLATLDVGAAYLPLDPDYPTDRLQFMVDDAAVRVVVSRRDVADRLSRDLSVVDPSALPVTDGSPAASTHAADDLAYVIYTSGSTGTPKGVQLGHRQVVNFFAGMDDVIGHDAPGVWLAVTSLSFDISVLELLWTLTRGFHVVVKQDSGFQPVRSFAGDAPTMSLFHFAAGGAQAGDGYRVLLESSRWGDEHGFEAVWTPERHFHDFGAPYPNPSVAAAAVAAVTERIGVRAGSVVLPLHSPVRVAEEWSVVDNLSNGRVGISFAAGWQPNDFVLNPAGYAGAREELPERIEAVRSLWRGETVELPGPDGELVPVTTLPRPVQPELPVWLTSAGSPASFERAGTLGVNLLTHLLGQSIEQLTDNIERYRAARRAAGHEGDGHVTLMLHTFLGADGDAARETAREPLTQYLGTAVGLIKNMASAFPTFAGAGADADEAFKSLTDDDIRQLLEMAADRYLSTSGLFGTVDDALDMVATATRAGVDEIACLIDFGIDADLVLSSLDLLGDVHDRLRRSGDELETVASLVERHGVTHFQCTPSLASMLLADPGERTALGSIRHMMVGGEACPTELARELCDVVPGRVTNMYGPTETTIWSLTHDIVTPVDGPVPIGTPIANTSVHVLDRHRRPVPLGVFGELFLGGDGVARGYLDRPELTAERFVELPNAGRVYATGDVARVRPDGIVEFAGRSDGQVKIRGHRIELGEIEAVLDRDTTVARSVVAARGDGEPTLVGYVVPAPGHDADPEALRRQLADRLPAAMVPSKIVVIDDLPLTPNGKVDRKRLPDPAAASSSETSAPVTDGSEAVVAAEWTRQLGIEVGRTDNFFDIGGHSLLAVNVFRNLAAQTGAAISLTDVFRFPTVQQFAQHLDRLLVDSTNGDGEGEPSGPRTDGGTDRGARRRRAMARRAGGGDG